MSRQIIQKFTDSFYTFIRESREFSQKEKEEIFTLFQNRTVRTVFHVSIYLIIWSFVVAFIDATLLTRGVVLTLLHIPAYLSFLPSIVFIIINAIVKFHFILFYTRHRIMVDTKHILVGVIPIVGSLFFTAYLLRNKPLIARALKKYFRYIRKHFRWIRVLRGQ